MILVKDISELFNENEKNILQKECDNFIVYETPNKDNRNSYVRYILDINNPKFYDVLKKIDLLISEYISGFNLILRGMWLNKIDPTTNQNDDFHYDASFFTFLFYLNDDFDGGEFQYIEEDRKIKKIQPKKYLAILSNNKLKHRVLPVKKGIRYSIVLFYDTKLKTKKTLM